MIQEKDFLYRVPVKNALVTTPGQQTRNPEILVDLEGGEFMHGNILDANSTNKLINQSVKDAVDNKLIESGYVTKDLLEAETTRATGAESALQTAIDTKADATALSNYVLTAALNQQVDTLNAAISAKQDAGSYIPYDQTVTSAYKIDKDIVIDNSIGRAMLGTYSISVTSNSNTEIQINPTGISLNDDGDIIRLSSAGITLPNGDFNHVLTSNGSTINMDNYAKNSDLSSQLGPKADRTDLMALEKKVTANTTAIEDKQDAGYYVTYIRDDGPRYILQKGFEISNGTNNVAIDESGVDINIAGGSITLDDAGIMGNDGDNNHYSINYNGINLFSMDTEIRISPISISSVDDEDTSLFNIDSTAIILGPTNNPNVKISEKGIKFKGRSASDIPIAGGGFVGMNNFVLAPEYNQKIKLLEARIAALEAKLS